MTHSVYGHIADAMKLPAIVRLDRNLFVARFETMKIYSALVAVERLLENGVVKHGDTLLDSSSGVYAYALALACHKYGMRCHIIASTVVDKTLLTQLKILGAKVERIQPASTLKLDQSQRVSRIKKIIADNPDIHWMQQYHDDIHYRGYHYIADHIVNMLNPEEMTLVGSVGSGCSTGGLTEALRNRNITTELIAVEPFGSMNFGGEHITDPEFIIAGIGSAIPCKNVKHALYDQINWVSCKYAISASVALLSRHAIFAGLSTGCNYLVAYHEAKRWPDRTVIFIAADTGHKYIDFVFSQPEAALNIDTLKPHRIRRPEQLSLPWSVMTWGRRPSPNGTARSCVDKGNV